MRCMCECNEKRIILLSSANNAKSLAKNTSAVVLHHYSAVITVPVSPRKPAAA